MNYTAENLANFRNNMNVLDFENFVNYALNCNNCPFEQVCKESSSGSCFDIVMNGVDEFLERKGE